LTDLPEFAKDSCKKCYGRGWRKKVKCEGRGQWVFDHYDICSCVLKNKRLPELWEKVNKAEEAKKKKSELDELMNKAESERENQVETEEVIEAEVVEVE